jgi:hypothetical protein
MASDISVFMVDGESAIANKPGRSATHATKRPANLDFLPAVEKEPISIPSQRRV